MFLFSAVVYGSVIISLLTVGFIGVKAIQFYKEN